MAQQQPDSLVRYDNPVLISTGVTQKPTQKKQGPANQLEKTRKDKEKRD